MYTFLIVAHLLIAFGIIVVVLLQRSEGQSLTASDAQAFGTRRTAAHPLSRLTAILAALFFITSLGLSVVGQHSRKPSSILDSAPAESQPPAQDKKPDEAPKPAVPIER